MVDVKIRFFLSFQDILKLGYQIDSLPLTCHAVGSLLFNRVKPWAKKKMSRLRASWNRSLAAFPCGANEAKRQNNDEQLMKRGGGPKIKKKSTSHSMNEVFNNVKDADLIFTQLKLFSFTNHFSVVSSTARKCSG